MYSTGDLVSCPMHGVGRIEGIESHTVLGATADYYSIRFNEGKTTALIPVASTDKIGLRSLIERDECEDVISYMNRPGDRGSDNWNQRYRDNMEKMRSGSIYRVADVVKCLMIRESEKGLSAGERKMLATAKVIIFGELATVLNVDQSAIEQRIG